MRADDLIASRDLIRLDIRFTAADVGILCSSADDQYFRRGWLSSWCIGTPLDDPRSRGRALRDQIR
jgi:hypothetical protein